MAKRTPRTSYEEEFRILTQALQTDGCRISLPDNRTATAKRYQLNRARAYMREVNGTTPFDRLVLSVDGNDVVIRKPYKDVVQLLSLDGTRVLAEVPMGPDVEANIARLREQAGDDPRAQLDYVDPITPELESEDRPEKLYDGEEPFVPFEDGKRQGPPDDQP